MITPPLASNILRRFSRDCRGVSAVEFALVAPVLIGLYFGVVEVSDGVAADRKVSLTVATVVNLTAQVTTISSSDMNNILDAATAIVSPYDASKLSLTVSCIDIDANKKVTVKWSKSRGSGSFGAVTVPSALTVASTQLILAQASYAYTPIVGYNITGTINLSDKMYMSPRMSAPTYPDAAHPCAT